MLNGHRKTDTEAIDDSGRTPLHLACERGRLDVVMLLIDQGADKVAQDSGNRTPLHLACREGNLDLVKLLIERGADTEAKDRLGRTPLHCACEGEHLDVVKLLIERGVEKEAKYDADRTPLHLACKGGHLDVGKLLIERGADTEAKDDADRTPLHLACESGHLDVVKLLIELGAEKEAKDNADRTPLHLACAGGHLDVVKLLIEQGEDTKAKDDADRTPLHLACAGGHLDLVNLLIERGADTEAKDSGNQTPLHLVCARGHVDVVKLLIESGANVKVKDDFERTPLHFASEEGHLDVVKLFIGRGADTETKDGSGMTPLHLACTNGHTNVVRLFIEKGANKEAKDNCGRTPIHCACLAAHVEVVDFLMSKGINLFEKDLFKNTVLHLTVYPLSSVKKHSVKGFIVNKILRCHTQSPLNFVNALNQKNETAIQIAFENGYFDVVQSLFLAAVGNVPRQLFSLSHTKFDLLVRNNDVTALEEFRRKLNLSDEARRQYEDHMRQIFSSSCTDDQCKELQQSISKSVPSDSVEDLALSLFIAIIKSYYKKIEKLVKKGRERELLNLRDSKGNTFIHLIASLISRHRNENIPNIDDSSPLLQDIFYELNRKYKEEDSRYLSLVTIACFLIDKGCDWTASNQRGLTAADELNFTSDCAIEIFKKECHRHYLAAIVRGTAMNKGVNAGNTLYRTDSLGRMSSTTLIGHETFKRRLTDLISKETFVANVAVETASLSTPKITATRGKQEFNTPNQQVDDPVSPSGSLRIDLGEESDHVSKMATALERTDISPTDNRDKPEHKSSDGDSSPEIIFIDASPFILSLDEAGGHHYLAVSSAMEIEQLETNASEAASHPPAKRRRAAANESTSQEAASITHWHFGYGRKTSAYGNKILHLKDPRGASYARNGKETTWRCSSKSCPAVVRKVKGDYEYKLYNNHSCASKRHGCTDVPPIPADIQQHLNDPFEKIMEFVNSQ